MKTVVKLIVLLVPLVLVACGGAAGPETVDLEVVMRDYEFVPNSYTVPAGAEVNLTLVNEGTQEHEWVLFESNYSLGAGDTFGEESEEHIIWEGEVEEAGGTETFTFTAPEVAGDYQVVCGIAGHFEEGMQGTFTVQP